MPFCFFVTIPLPRSSPKAYYHEKLLRGQPELAGTVERVKTVKGGSNIRKPSNPEDSEIDFYVLPPLDDKAKLELEAFRTSQKQQQTAHKRSSTSALQDSSGKSRRRKTKETSKPTPSTSSRNDKTNTDGIRAAVRAETKTESPSETSVIDAAAAAGSARFQSFASELEPSPILSPQPAHQQVQDFSSPFANSPGSHMLPFPFPNASSLMAMGLNVPSSLGQLQQLQQRHNLRDPNIMGAQAANDSVLLNAASATAAGMPTASFALGNGQQMLEAAQHAAASQMAGLMPMNDGWDIEPRPLKTGNNNGVQGDEESKSVSESFNNIQQQLQQQLQSQQDDRYLQRDQDIPQHFLQQQLLQNQSQQFQNQQLLLQQQQHQHLQQQLEQQQMMMEQLSYQQQQQQQQERRTSLSQQPSLFVPELSLQERMMQQFQQNQYLNQQQPPPSQNQQQQPGDDAWMRHHGFQEED